VYLSRVNTVRNGGAAMTGSPPLELARTGREVRRVLWITLWLNLAVSAAKVAVGMLTSTLSLVADGYHSLMDGSGNILGLITLRFAQKPPDEDHQYGHRKFEVLASMAISILLFATAGEILLQSFGRLRAGGVPSPNWVTIATALGTLAVNLFVTRYESRRGRELHSSFLIADSRHTLSDVYATIGVLTAILLSRAGMTWADPIAAVMIAGVIVVAGYRILTSGLNVVADRAVIDAARIEEVALSFPRVQACRQVRTRGFEDAVFLDLIVLLDPGLSLQEAHELCDRMEATLHVRFPQLADIVIHPEPELDAREVKAGTVGRAP
jgi:cation diffusion facilitator family transporter